MMQKMLGVLVDSVKSDHKYCSDQCPKTGDHLYSLRIPYGAAYEEVYEVLNEMMADIKKYEQDIKEQADQAKAEDAPCDGTCDKQGE